MPKAKTSFSITVGSLPIWYPAWQAPGVIKSIPNSSLQGAITANGWTEPVDIVGGGTPWPRALYAAWTGGTVAYVDGQPYLCVSGGGHATTSDNSIYAFGPLAGTGSDTPAWMRLGPQSANADTVKCVPRNLDGRPTSRHTVGDFSYGNGRIVMMWENSVYCENGGTNPGIDVFDIAAREWDAAKNPPVTHPTPTLNGTAHAMSAFHPQTGLFYAKGKGAVSDGFGSYDPLTKIFTKIPYSGFDTKNDSVLVTMGPRPYLLTTKSGGDPVGRINVETGVGESWGGPSPSGAARTAGYDSHRDRIYIPTTGISPVKDGMPAGSRTVAWADAAASSAKWTTETFNGDIPDQQQATGTYGRWCYVPELRGFVLNNAVDSPVYFYRTAQ